MNIKLYVTSKREQLAQKLQTAIFDAIFLPKENKGIKASKWLRLQREPTLAESFYPPKNSYIETCYELGINWRELRQTLKSAIATENVPPTLYLIEDANVQENRRYHP